MSDKILNIRQLDIWLMITYLVLVAIGWLSIFSSTYAGEDFDFLNLSKPYGKQSLWIIVSLVIAIIILLLDVKIIVKMAFPFYWLVLVTLVLTLLIGSIISGNKAWINLGNGILFQPSEFAKYGVSLVIAYLLNLPAFTLENKKNIILIASLIAVPVLIILLQNDTGSAVVFLAFFFLFYRLGISNFYLFLMVYSILLFVLSLLVKQYILLLSVTFLFVIGVFFFRNHREGLKKLIFSWIFSLIWIIATNYIFFHVLKKHQQDRINVLIGREYEERGSAFNIKQSMIAIGSGGLIGKGLFRGTQTKYNFVPAQHTDFIFSAVGEQLGFVGSTILILLYVFILIRMINLAEKQRSTFSFVFIYSTALIIFIHFFINIGMSISLVPVIGIPLPFVSYGGSSLLSFTLMYFTTIKLIMHRHETL
ncbi:MAG: rod shape-determining protein RodA [Bacteroidales bacterium]|nr:rod shape-determining protein RodA [Bacteroidales bacterium]